MKHLILSFSHEITVLIVFAVVAAFFAYMFSDRKRNRDNKKHPPHDPL